MKVMISTRATKKNKMELIDSINDHQVDFRIV